MTINKLIELLVTKFDATYNGKQKEEIKKLLSEYAENDLYRLSNELQKHGRFITLPELQDIQNIADDMGIKINQKSELAYVYLCVHCKTEFSTELNICPNCKTNLSSMPLRCVKCDFDFNDLQTYERKTHDKQIFFATELKSGHKLKHCCPKCMTGRQPSIILKKF